MALADAVQGARHVAQEITWKDKDDNLVDLTGADITGVKRTTDGNNVVTAIDGQLELVGGETAKFTWTYGENDVAEAGEFEVQFTATYGEDDLDRSLLEDWKVHEAPSPS